MAISLINRTCDLCRGEKPCTCISFHPAGEGKAAPAPFAGTRGIPAANQFPMYCCEDCGRQQGMVKKTAWILTILGYVLFIGGIAVAAGIGEDAVGAAVFLMMLGWCLMVFAPMALFFKLRNECSPGAVMGMVFAQFIPVVGLIVLLAKAKDINRNYRAISALRTAADARVRQEKRKDEEMTRMAANEAALTEEQKKQVEEYRKEKERQEQAEEATRQAAQEKINRGNYRGAILGVVFTIILAFIGISQYSSGRGYMTFFGIELSPGGFAALIGAFLVWDIVSIVNAKKKM